MATGVEELVDMLFTMVDEAKNAAFSTEKCVIDRENVLNILDDIRAQLPVELAEARKFMTAKNEHIAAAKREAEDIRRRAELEAKQMVNTDQIMSMAKQQAHDIIRQAEDKSRELRRTTNEYCEDMLRRVEEALEEAFHEMRGTRNSFRVASGNSASNSSSVPKNPRVFDVETQG